MFFGATAIGGYLYFKLDDEIRRQVEVRFANHYHNFDVHVGSARFDPERGIAIDDLSLTPKKADGSKAEPVLSIDEMYLVGNLRIEQLLTNQMQISDIVVRHAKLRMAREPDGHWSTAELLPLPHFSDQSPNITIEDASGTVAYATAPGTKPWSLQGVNLKLTPLPPTEGEASAAKRYHIEGNASGLPTREFRVDGQIGASNGLLDLTVTAAGLDISPQLMTSLPSSAIERMGGAKVSGQADVTVHLNRTDSSASAKLDRGISSRPRSTQPSDAARCVNRRFVRGQRRPPAADYQTDGCKVRAGERDIGDESIGVGASSTARPVCQSSRLSA